MIVSKFNLKEAVEEINEAAVIALDTETTGLYPYKGDKIFSLIIHTGLKGYYFNFNDKPDHLGEVIDDVYTFNYEEVALLLIPNLKKFDRVYIHNAKFDLHHILQSFGASYLPYLLEANIFCTQAMVRLAKNDLPSYSLANLGKKIGYDKDKTVEEYISKNKLYTLEDIGKKEPRKNKHYNLVPLNIIAPYGITDGKVCYELGEAIYTTLQDHNEDQLSLGYIGNEELVSIEQKLTKVLLKMERVGVKTNRGYCEKAVSHYEEVIEKAKKDFLELTGIEFSDSRKVLTAAFTKLGLDYPTTDKGNASFTDKVLEATDNPIANIIKKYRDAYKNANTYYKNFLELSDDNDVLHTSLVQGGTRTGRMSCREPNLQNVPKRSEKGFFKARRAFVPRKGYFFAMLDYDQMEYRLFMDYAEEMELIEKVLSGLDVHTATAEMVKVMRDVAKTINFLLLYGGGDAKLANELGIELALARQYKSDYFKNLENVKRTNRAIIRITEERGYIFNIMGRRCYIPKDKAYKAPNALIQGGCGDIVKKAMINLDKYLENKDSRMLLQIHDEILFEIKNNEYTILEDLKKIMVEAYDYKHLPLTAGVEFSFESWADKKEVDYALFKSFT